MKKTLFLFLFGSILLIKGYSQDISEELKKAQKLTYQWKEEEALQVYKKILIKDELNYEALTKASFLLSRCGNRKSSKEEKIKYFAMAKRFAEYALKQKPNASEPNYLMALALGRYAQNKSAKQRVAMSKEIRKYAEKAIQINPKHAGAWFLLGKWHFKVANLNFAERAAANLLFGGAPKGASNSEAIKCMKKAIELRPKYTLYYYDLAVVYEDIGEDDNARKYLKKAIELPNGQIDDYSIKKKCKALLDDL